MYQFEYDEDPNQVIEEFKRFIAKNHGKNPTNIPLRKTAHEYIKKIKDADWSYLPMVSNFSLEEFRFFIQVTDINLAEQQDGYTFLHALAINSVNPEVFIDALHQNTINLKIVGELEPEPFNNTPLHLVIANECYENAISYINSAKAKNIAIDYSVQDSQGKTTLILSAKQRATSMVAFIIENMPSERREEWLNIQDNEGNTALHYAMLLGDVGSVKKLIESGAKTDINNLNGHTPLNLLSVVHSNRIDKVLESVCVKPMRDEKARVNIIACSANVPPNTVDFNTGNIQSFDICAKKDEDTKTAIEKMVRAKLLHPKRGMSMFGSEAMFMTKEEKQGFVDLYNSFTGKSVKQACLDGRAKLMAEYAPQELFSISGLKLDKSNLGQRLRQNAVEGNVEVLSYLLDIEKADVSGASLNGNTALHWAAQNGHVTCYKLLLSSGADETLKNKDGKTPKELLLNAITANQARIKSASITI
ncbi:MAG: hypothetical protein HKM04_09670 [Legionellales bacterium]|nr:hypothetical protein [Legionellales bacterium]